MSYWKDREAEALKSYQLEEKAYEAELKRHYEYMQIQIQKEIDAFYGKYAAGEHISMEVAMKRINEMDVKAFAKKAAKYVKEKDFSEQANYELKIYNAKMRINRLELLKANIGLEMIDAHNSLDKYFEKILKDRALEEFARQAGILGESILNNAKLANAIVNASFKNATFSTRIWSHQTELKADLEKLLTQGLVSGKNPNRLAPSLRYLCEKGRFECERLMRTELARVQTEAQKQSFERNGFQQYKFIANHNDGKTCGVCKDMDGEVFEVKDMMPGENAPPMHPNCRCSTAAHMDDKEYEEWLDSFSEHKMGFDEWRTKNIAKSGTSDIIKTRKTDFYGAGDKILPAELSSWIGKSKYKELMSQAYGNEAKKYIRTAYRKNSIIGDGGTVAVRKFEKETGRNLGRNQNTHSKKVDDLVRQIEKSLTKSMSDKDRVYLNQELLKLKEVQD